MDKNQIRENYNKLSSYLEEVSALRGVSYLLDWDQQVVMPSKSSTFRGKQLSAIAGILHEKQTNPDIGRLIDTLQNITDDSLDKWEKANVRDAKRNFDKATKIPKELAQREATLLSKGYETWINAKKENNFSQFVPVLKDWVSLRKEQAKYIDASKDPYDVLLDNYERGLNIEQINKVFDQVKSGLIPLIEKIKTKPSPNKEFLKDKKFDVDVQVKLNHQIAKDLGFDLESGRLDVSAHPFTSEIHATDVRMTTRYKDNDLMEGISGTVHETGHALYEQGRNKDYSDQPVSSALSMGIHESQSLTWERMVGLSLSFWKRYGPKVLEAFPQIGSNITAEQFYVAVNEVRPSLIRVEADEVTYPLHIVLRTELERGLIEGTIAVEDLPKLWNERMEKYLGVVPPTDAEGVLQDVHWATGAFGYFPTYLLGAIYASQFFAQAEKELPELYESIEAGNFVPLREWLREKIHSKGSLLPSGDELVKEVTGEALNPKVFLNHLTTKYSKLYNL